MQSLLLSCLSTDACREEGAIVLTLFSSWPRRPLLPSGWIWSCTGAYKGSCYGYSSLYSHWVLSQIGKAGNSHEVSETGGGVRGGKNEKKREKKPVSIRTVTEVQVAAVQNSEKTPFTFTSISCGSVITRKVEIASGLCFHFSFLYCSPAPSTRCDLWFNEYFLRLVHVRHTAGTKICWRSSGPTSSRFTYLFYDEFFLSVVTTSHILLWSQENGCVLSLIHPPSSQPFTQVVSVGS